MRQRGVQAEENGWVMRWLPPGVRRLKEIRDPEVFRTDLIAGISVALLLVPQAMAFAQLAGLPTQAGFYAALLPPIFAALFGSSRQMVTGPVSLISLMTFAAISPLANGDMHLAMQAAMMLALLVGLIQLGLGLLRLGVLVDFLSHPVVVGFTNAGVIIIATAQMGKVFGVSAQKEEWHFLTVWNTLQAMAQGVHWPTVGLAALSFAIIYAVRRLRPRWPSVLVAVAVATMVSWLTGFGAAGGRVIGEIPTGLPRLTLPPMDTILAMSVLPSAIVIALLGYLEAVSIARALAAKTRQRLQANQELFGQGAANLAAALSGGYPVSASFSRSAVNLDNGGRTPFSAIVASSVVALTLLFLTPLLYHLPQATLAVIIIVAVAGLFHIRLVVRAWRVERHDAVVAVVTFVLTLVFAPRLEVGIFGGILLSVALFVYRTMRPRVALLVRLDSGRLADAHNHPERPRCSRILVIRQYMSLYFANAGHFENRILHFIAEYPQAQFVILDFSAVNTIDSSGMDVIIELKRRLEKLGIELLIARANHYVRAALKSCLMLEEEVAKGERSKRAPGEAAKGGGFCIFERPTDAICYALERVRCPDCGDGARCPLRRPGDCADEDGGG